MRMVEIDDAFSLLAFLIQSVCSDVYVFCVCRDPKFFRSKTSWQYLDASRFLIISSNEFLLDLYLVNLYALMVLMTLRDLERRIVEAEMDLTLAKSQGYLKNQLRQSGSSSAQLLAVIGVYTGFGSKLKRTVFRGSWMPKGDLDCLLQMHSMQTL